MVVLFPCPHPFFLISVFIQPISLMIHYVKCPLLWFRTQPTAGKGRRGQCSLCTYLVPSQVPPCEAGVISPFYIWENRGWGKYTPAEVPVSRRQRWDLNP